MDNLGNASRFVGWGGMVPKDGEWANELRTNMQKELHN